MPKGKCVVTDIYWERIFLHIELKDAFDKKLYLRGHGEFYSLIQKKTDKGENTSEIVINMSAVSNRTFMENGSWRMGYFNIEGHPASLNDVMLYPNQPKRIKASTPEMFEHNKPFRAPKSGEGRSDAMYFCIVANEVVKKFDSLTRVFRYSGTKYAYTVNFTVFTTDDTCLHFYINSFFMKTNGDWDKQDYKLEASTARGRRKKRFLAFEKRVTNRFYRIASRLFPHKEKNILLLSETSNTLQGNLAAIYNRIKERGLDTQFNVDVFCRETIGTHVTHRSQIRLVWKIAQAGTIIVDNFTLSLTYLDLEKDTKIVQVWHAGAGFKGVGYMRFGKEGSPLPAESVHKKYALALAPSEQLIKVFEEVFGIEEEAFLPVGMPRLDNYLEPTKVETFKTKFYKDHPELKGRKIILFAPTYRGKGQSTAYYNYSKVNFERLYEFCGDEYAVLVKMHSFLIGKKGKSKNRTKPDLSKYAPRIFDFTTYPDINELFYITDILITDYSSVYYEFSIFKRPILFYTYDRLFYENTRGVYQDVKESAPGKVCDSFQKLMEALEKKDYDLEKTIKFSESQFPHAPEGATDKVLDKVLLSEKERP